MTLRLPRWITPVAFCFLTFTVALLLWQQVSSAAKVLRVEYRVLETLSLDNNARLETQLNAFGQTGWELVLVDIGNVTKPAPRFIFKRVEQP
jgi:hypothetical protein